MPTDRVVRELELPSGDIVSVELPSFLSEEDRLSVADGLVSLGCSIHPEADDWDEPPNHEDLVGWYEWSEATAPFTDGDEEDVTFLYKWLAEGRRVMLVMPTRNEWDHELSIIWFLFSLAVRMLCAKVIGHRVTEVGVEE